MAQIYPQWISKSEREANPHRRAEYLVYDKLNEQLGDNWLVLYGSAIKWTHQYGVSDRETEFIIAHPSLGALALEVKGGSVTREGNTWYTTWLSELHKPESLRERHRIKNPYTQVTDAAEAYRRKIDDYIYAQRLPIRFPKIGTAVCFPYIEVPNAFFVGADAPREITLDRTDLDGLKDRIYRILKLYQGKSGNPPGKMGIDILKQVLARSWHIDSFMAYQLEGAEERRKELTKEQFHLLYNLQGNPKMLISGCAGSGKTMIAAEKARRLAEQGQRVLFTCYNENLANWLRGSEFARSSMIINHFHQLCYQLASSSKEVNLPGWTRKLGIDKETYFHVKMPEALELAAIDIGITFDAVIVDEGQDFKASWLKTLHELLTDPESGVFYIFYDDNQRIYNQSNIPFSWPSFRLRKNMRNTNPIFAQLKRYYHHPAEILPSGNMGPDPWFVNPKDYDDEYQALQYVLERLTEQKIEPSRITILTPRAKQNSLWGKKPDEPGKFAPVWKLNTIANQVSCCTVQSFKGLESPVIILTELEHLYPQKATELLYVAISRAKDYLVVVGQLPC